MEASKLRLRIATLSIAAIVAALMVVPALASATVVDDVLNGLGLGAGQGGQQAPSGKGHGSTKSGVPPDYVPPLHGTNPHGEGDAATISLAPTGPNPVTGTPGQPESVVLGSSKGEQNADGTYHGHINVLSLFGNELISVDSTPGQTNHGPLEPLQTQLLDAICTGSGGQLCLTVLQADSSTNGTGSTNSFSVATAQIGTGANSISADAVTSTGNISSDGTCQTSTGTRASPTPMSLARSPLTRSAATRPRGPATTARPRRRRLTRTS